MAGFAAGKNPNLLQSRRRGDVGRVTAWSDLCWVCRMVAVS